MRYVVIWRVSLVCTMLLGVFLSLFGSLQALQASPSRGDAAPVSLPLSQKLMLKAAAIAKVPLIIVNPGQTIESTSGQFVTTLYGQGLLPYTMYQLKDTNHTCKDSINSARTRVRTDIMGNLAYSITGGDGVTPCLPGTIVVTVSGGHESYQTNFTVLKPVRSKEPKLQIRPAVVTNSATGSFVSTITMQGLSAYSSYVLKDDFTCQTSINSSKSQVTITTDGVGNADFVWSGGSNYVQASTPCIPGTYHVTLSALPTPTPSPTATATEIPSPTATATEIPSPTATATETPSPTATATEIPSPTATATEIPSPTATATEIPSPTATATAIPSPIATATEIPSPTATATAIPTPIPSPSVTPPPAFDLAISNSNAGGASAVVGDSISYTLTVLNVSGLVPANNAIIVTDSIPVGLTDVSVSSPTSDWVVTVNASTSPSFVVATYLGTTPIRASTVLPGITILGTLTVDAIPVLTDTASVASIGDRNPVNNIVTTTISVSAAPTPTPIPSPTPTPTFHEYQLPKGSGRLSGIAYGSDGGIWYLDPLSNRLGRVNPDDGSVETYSIPTVGSLPDSLVAGLHGDLWFTERGASQIGHFVIATTTFTELSIPTARSAPEGIAMDSNGQVWFVEHDANQIGVVTISGVIQEFPIPTPNSGAQKIVVDVHHNVWFSEHRLGNIGRLASDGTFTTYPLASNTVQPSGIAVSADGSQVWFVEQGTSQVGRLDVQTGTISGSVIPSSKGRPGSLILTPSGRFWFVQPATNQIASFDPTQPESITEYTAPTANSRPQDLTVDGNGAIWFTENYTHKVGKLQP